jgi:outer membrane protein OmpA-like peptidoglycan-associated protein
MRWLMAASGSVIRVSSNFLGAGLAFCIGLALAAPAVCQSRDQRELRPEQLEPGEAIIGTFELDPSARDDGDERAGAPDEQERLYQSALAELGRGRASTAQRLLERVIAADPDSELARHSRRRLADLYRGEASFGSAASLPWAPGGRQAREPALDGGVIDGRGKGDSRSALARDAPHPVSAELEQRFILEAGDRVFFSSGSAELGLLARRVLAAQARWLKERPDLDATIEGHADDSPLGIVEQEELSEARAEAVRQRLIAEGVEAQRIGVAPWGRERRLSECDGPDCAAQNRRAITVLTIGRRKPAKSSAGRYIGPAAVEGEDVSGWVR